MMRWLTIALLLAACGGTSPSQPPSQPVANVAPAPATLRLPRLAPRIGSVRTEQTVTRGEDRETRKVTRTEVLAVEGLVITKARVTYLEVAKDEAPLAGKTFIVTRRAGQTDVEPTDGTPPGDEELVRKDLRNAGKPDSTMMMVTDRDFAIGRTVNVKPPSSLPEGTKVQLTLRSFDETTATFDMDVAFTSDRVGVKASGRMVVDRATGRETLASIRTEYTVNDRVEHGTLELEATTE